jgi:uncharacterized protein YkwD
MGVESRDWYRAEEIKRARRISSPLAVLLIIGVVGGVVLAGALDWKGSPPADYGGTLHTHSGPTVISIAPGLPNIRIGGDPLYAKNDPWVRFLADEQTCPGGEQLDAPLQQQAETMACLINYARTKRGLAPLATVRMLNSSSLAKAAKIARCRDFNHNACGEDAAEDVRALGYRGAWGENLFIAGGPYGAPRPALDGWLNSPHHRENLFRPEWQTQGIAVSKLAKFGRDRNMTLWVNQFGTF